MKKYVVTLSKDERDELTALTSKGKHKSQKILNALILLSCDTGEFQKQHSKNEEIARVLNVSMRKIDRVKKRFIEDGVRYSTERQNKEAAYTRGKPTAILKPIWLH